MERNAARKLIGELSGLPYFPTEPSAISALVDVIEHNCINQAHAQAVIREFLESVTSDSRCPTPADLRRQCFSIRERFERRHEDHNCDLCSGTGYRRVYVIATRTNGRVRCERLIDGLQDAAGDSGETWAAKHAERKRNERCLGPGQYIAECAALCECRAGNRLAMARYTADAEESTNGGCGKR